MKSLPSCAASDKRWRSPASRRLEDAVVEWIGRAVADPPVEFLPDGELLAFCDATLDGVRQEELSVLLADLREGTLATLAACTARRAHGRVSTRSRFEGPRLIRGRGPRPSPSPGRSCRMILCPPTLRAVCAKPPRTGAGTARVPNTWSWRGWRSNISSRGRMAGRATSRTSG